jgi:hypothetical protein
MRSLTILAPLLAAATLSGCSPADAQKAQQILQEAQQAQQSVNSETFLVKLSFAVDGKSAEIDMQGGGYTKTGDFYMTMSGSMPGGTALPLDVAVVKRGGEVRLRMSGQTQTLSVAAAQQQLGGQLNTFSQFSELAKYVKDGSVSETDFQGRPADKLVGILDTQSMVASAGGTSGDLFGKLGIHLGDVRVVLFVPRDTHLVEAMIADTTMSAAGKSVRMTMSLGVTGVNQPVDFPSL